MKYPKFISALLLATILFSLFACTDNNKSLPNPRTVIVSEVKLSSTSGRRLSGKLQAAQRSSLSFEISGVINSIDVNVGDSFLKDTVLAELDTRSLLLELSAQQASLLDAEATLTNATLDYERHSSLKSRGAVSQSAFDRSQAVFTRAKAQVEISKAELERSKKRVSDATIVAPFDGEVVARLAEPSEVVQRGSTALRIVGTESNLEAIVLVPSSIRQTMSIDQTISITLSSSGNSIEGRVTQISSQANQTGSFPVTISLNNAPTDARPGEVIEAIFLTHQSGSIQIPLTAYSTTGENEGVVYVVTGDTDPRVLIKTPIQLGALNDNGIAVTSGLSEGSLIVTKGVEFLNDGESVFTVGHGPKRYND